MKHFGLIGKSLNHSFSPDYFTRKFEQLRINADYVLCPIEQITDFKELLTKKEWHGFNVTIPYKSAIIPLLDEIDSEASLIGSINTIVVDSQKNSPSLVGYNTDIIGFTKSIQPHLKSQHQQALILGTGATAKMVAYAFAKMGIQYQFVTRQASGRADTITYEQLTAEHIAQNMLIINTTPVGMYPLSETLITLPYHAITKHHLLFDLIYNPGLTPFLAAGKAQGATTINGLEMLYQQADAAFHLWYS